MSLFEQTCAYHNIEPNKPTYSIEEAAKILDKPAPTVWRWCRDGKIETVRLAGTSYQKVPNTALKNILTPTAEPVAVAS